jgi:mannosyltransferase OCH1-like enzyme
MLELALVRLLSLQLFPEPVALEERLFERCLGGGNSLLDGGGGSRRHGARILARPAFTVARVAAVIPRILHQVWVGPHPVPQQFVDYRESWRRHHPDWDMHLWTEDSLPDDLVRPEAYERLRSPAERSDIIRLEVLHRFGGVYVDTDVECLRPIDPLLEEAGDFFVGEVKGKVENAVIGAVPEHAVLERALRELRPVTEYGVDLTRGTGPWFLTALLRDYPDVTIYPQEIFSPMTDAEREQAYAVHHYVSSWKTAEHWEEKAVRAREKLIEARKWNDQLEALVGLRGPSAGFRAWRSRLGERLRHAPRPGD